MKRHRERDGASGKGWFILCGRVSCLCSLAVAAGDTKIVSEQSSSRLQAVREVTHEREKEGPDPATNARVNRVVSVNSKGEVLAGSIDSAASAADSQRLKNNVVSIMSDVDVTSENSRSLRDMSAEEATADATSTYASYYAWPGSAHRYYAWPSSARTWYGTRSFNYGPGNLYKYSNSWTYTWVVDYTAGTVADYINGISAGAEGKVVDRASRGTQIKEATANSLGNTQEPVADAKEKTKDRDSPPSNDAKESKSQAEVVSASNSSSDNGSNTANSPEESRAAMESLESLPSGWRWIQNELIAQELTWDGVGSSTPECFQGIFWLDQDGFTLPQLPVDAADMKIYGSNADAIEYVATFGLWDAWWGTIATPVENAWTYGAIQPENGKQMCDMSISSLTVMTFTLTGNDPCVEGAIFEGPAIPYYNGSFANLYIVRSSYGFVRRTVAKMSSGVTVQFEYPVVPVIDKNGCKTEFFETYLKEANNKIPCEEYKNDCTHNPTPGYAVVCDHGNAPAPWRGGVCDPDGKKTRGAPQGGFQSTHFR